LHPVVDFGNVFQKRALRLAQIHYRVAIFLGL
jgi:hypothetical protein